MALVNTLTVDLSANTVTLTSTYLGNNVEVLTYSQSANTVVFSSRSSITVSGIDFLNFIAQIKLFQAAILLNFNANQFQTSPYTGVNINEVYVSFINQWECQISIASAANFINHSASLGTQLVTLGNRSSQQILNFSEWIVVLSALNHYDISIKNYFGI